MKKVLALIVSGFMIMQASAQYVDKVGDPVEWVNPLMGTDSRGDISNGNTYPSIGLPWGMNCWTPQTGNMGDGWQYTYGGEKILGFKQTHQPSPWMNDYGEFSIMPVTGHRVFTEEARASWYSHKAETVKPYAYSVYLADHDVNVEMAPTDRAAIFRFTYPATDSAFTVVDAYDKGSYIRIIPRENKIIGYSTRNSGSVPANFRNYFVLVFDHPFRDSHVWHDDKLDSSGLDSSGLEISGEHTGALVQLAIHHRGEIVQVRVASSFISPEQAELNLSREIGSDGFDTVAAHARQRWNAALSRVEVEGGTIDQVRTFYSSLYRMLFFPMKLYEQDAQGHAVHYSPYTGKVSPGSLYGGTGFWDTFRALYPFLNLLYPSVNNDMQKGLISDYTEGGWLPEWSSPGYRDIMVGNNSASVVADAWLKGGKGYDISVLYDALQKGANHEGPIGAVGRAGVGWYTHLGYIPCDIGLNENVARTLEYAYDDFTIWQLARALHRPDAEIAVYARRCMNYKYLFDPGIKLMRGKTRTGAWQQPFNPFKWGDDFTEGNSWHYTWSVFHDVQGLQGLMGGKETMVRMLDSVFILPPVFDDSYYGGTIHEIREMQIAHMGQYAHGNQPIQHMIYLYNYAGAPWKTQYWAREIMNRLYKATPDGYCGDEDNGQTSAWYVFSALGFYPVCPGTDQYVLGAPLFKKVTLHQENGKDFVLDAPGNSDLHRYVQKATLNGAAYTKTWLSHATIQQGGIFQTEMGATPNFQKGITPDDYPYSFSTDTAAARWLSMPAGGILSRDSATIGKYTLIFINKSPGFDPVVQQNLIRTYFEVYPKEAALYNKATARKVVFVMDPAYEGVAESWGDSTRFNPDYFARFPKDIDVVTHEVMHIAQAYPDVPETGWITEGIADYVRYTVGVDNKGAGWSLPDYAAGQSYKDAYRITARFFVWIERHGHAGLVRKLDGVMRSGAYKAALWQEWTGATVDQLWERYSKDPGL